MKDEGRTYVSLSMSCPPELEVAVNRRSAELGVSRSEYVRKLVLEEMSFKPLNRMNKEKKEDRFGGFDTWECETISDALLEEAKRQLALVGSVSEENFGHFMQIIELAQEAHGSLEEES